QHIMAVHLGNAAFKSSQIAINRPPGSPPPPPGTPPPPSWSGVVSYTEATISPISLTEGQTFKRYPRFGQLSATAQQLWPTAGRADRRRRRHHPVSARRARPRARRNPARRFQRQLAAR